MRTFIILSLLAFSQLHARDFHLQTFKNTTSVKKKAVSTSDVVGKLSKHTGLVALDTGCQINGYYRIQDPLLKAKMDLQITIHILFPELERNTGKLRK